MEADGCLLCGVWSLGRDDLNSWGLESSGSISTHVSGARTEVTQKPSSWAPVNQSSYSWFLREAHSGVEAHSGAASGLADFLQGRSQLQE